MTILCGTDLSDASGGALDVALALAGQRGDHEIALVHVIDPESGGSPAEREELIDRGRNELEALVANRGGAITIKSELIVGPPHDTLVRYADTESCDLIVIAARSNSGGSLLRLGSTAEHVVARAQVPVVIVRDPAPWLAFTRGERPLRVLLGVDDSTACDLGIQWTRALRGRGAIDLVLGAIYYPDDASDQYGLHASNMVDRDPEIEKLMARDLLHRYGADPDGKGTLVARPKRGLGRVGDHLIELARDENVDVIVIGTSQKTGLGRLGSVSTVIVHDAPQSIVCVPPSNTVAITALPSLRTALVATDLSPFANRAVPYAFALTGPGGDIHVVHVVKDDADVDDAELSRSLLALTPSGATHKVTPHIVRGDDAAVALAQAAARLGVDVVCIASHGRTGITRALVGSVADRLLHATHVPVLVLRPS